MRAARVGLSVLVAFFAAAGCTYILDLEETKEESSGAGAAGAGGNGAGGNGSGASGTGGCLCEQAVAVAPGEVAPESIILDEDNAYWIGGSGSARGVRSMPIDAIDAADDLIPDESKLVQIVKCGDRICGTSVPTSGSGKGLRRSTVGGNSMEPLVIASDCMPSNCDIERIAGDSENLYWVDTGNYRFSKLLLSQDPPTETQLGYFAAGGLRDVAVGSDGVYLAVDTTILRYTNTDGAGGGGGDGGGSTTVISSILPYRIALGTSAVCWLDTSNNTVRCNVSQLSIDIATSPVAIAIDGTRVYWAESDAVYSVNTDGSAPRTIATGQNSPSSIAVGSGWVYWTNKRDGGGEVMRASTTCNCE